MITECRHDCEYYSNYTDTCDYTLLMYESRGCPIDACTRYMPRTQERRTWSVWNRKQGPNPREISCAAVDYISSLPTFDADTFYELTGIRVERSDDP